MKKFLSLLSAAAIAGVFSTAQAFTLVMPGTYNGWKLEQNQFELVDGKYQQTIPDLYSNFKVVGYDGESPSWQYQYCSNGTNVQNGVAYEASLQNKEDIFLYGSADNLHYYNAKVTVTLSDDLQKATILVEAERVEKPADKWQIIGGDTPFAWDFNGAPEFEATETDNVFKYSYEGKILAGTEFKIGKNGAWQNTYATKNTLERNTDYVELDGPGDLNYNCKVPEDGLLNPTFFIKVDGDKVSLKIEAEAIQEDRFQLLGADPIKWEFSNGRIFERQENGDYVLKLDVTLWGGFSFKIVRNADWNQTFSTGKEITYGDFFALEGPADLDDMKLPAGDLVDATFTLKVDGDNVQLKVESSPDTWQLIGDEPLSWNFGTNFMTPAENGEYALTVKGKFAAGGKVKVIKNSLWSNTYSSAAEITLDNFFALDGPNKDIADMIVPATGLEDPTFTLKVEEGTPKLKVKNGKSSGIADIEADDAAEAVYYNLQGIRINNPSHGTYIRVTNNRASKVRL